MADLALSGLATRVESQNCERRLYVAGLFRRKGGGASERWFAPAFKQLSVRILAFCQRTSMLSRASLVKNCSASDISRGVEAVDSPTASMTIRTRVVS